MASREGQASDQASDARQARSELAKAWNSLYKARELMKGDADIQRRILDIRKKIPAISEDILSREQVGAK